MSNREKSLEDIFDEYMAATDRPDQQSLERFVAQYPDRIDDLTELTADWLVLATIDDNLQLQGDANDEAVSREISNFQNRLYSMNQDSEDQGIESLFDDVSPALLRDAANELNVAGPLLVKLRYRLIVPATIPKLFVAAVAKIFGVSFEQVTRYLDLAPKMPIADYKTEGKPKRPEQQPFVDAMKSADMSESAIIAWTTDSKSATRG